MNQLKYLAPLLLLILNACEKNIDLKGTNEEKRIVVNSVFVTNSDSLEIGLYQSLNVLEPDTPVYLKNADIELYINNVKQNNLRQIGKGHFVLHNIQLKTGDHLKLGVSAKTFNPVQSSVTVPSLVPVNNWKMTYKKAPDMYYADSVAYFTVNIEDPPDENNYYELNLLMKRDNYYYIYESEKYNGFIETDIYSDDPVLNEHYSWYNDGLYFDDKLINGKNYNLGFYVYEEIDTVNQDSVIIELRTLSKELFLYRTSAYKQMDAQDNPFAQPVQVYSNIKNGAGIFAGYAASRIYIE